MTEVFKLRECPFCGAPAKLERKDGDLYHIAARHGSDCLLFAVKIPPTFGREAISRKWNTRAGETKKSM